MKQLSEADLLMLLELINRLLDKKQKRRNVKVSFALFI